MDKINSNKYFAYTWAFIKTRRNECGQLGHQESAICQFYFLTLYSTTVWRKYSDSKTIEFENW